MRKWEYRWVHFLLTFSFKETIIFDIALPEQIKIPAVGYPDVDYINKLGEEGWEVIQTSGKVGEDAWYVLKRPKQ